jgi:membrane-bound serine protease (ClpP class)
MPLWVSLALLLVGMGTIFAELLLPAGGLIGIAGFGAMVAGIVLGFVHHGTTVGTTLLIGSLLLMPFIVALGLKIFPNTFVGKRLILKDVLVGETKVPAESEDSRLPELVGKEGVALTDLRPSGMIRVDGRKLSVVTLGDYIEHEARVKVIKTEGNRIVVRRLRDGESTSS